MPRFVSFFASRIDCTEYISVGPQDIVKKTIFTEPAMCSLENMRKKARELPILIVRWKFYK
jgi:hypothetical protein